MKLADPGVGVADLFEFLRKRQILIGNIAGNPHLAYGVHGQSYWVGVYYLLHVVTIFLRNLQISGLFKRINSLY